MFIIIIIQRIGGWRQSIPPPNGNRKLLQEVYKEAFVTSGVHNVATLTYMYSEGHSKLQYNKCELMVCMGGEVTVLLDLGLLCLV